MVIRLRVQTCFPPKDYLFKYTFVNIQFLNCLLVVFFILSTENSRLFGFVTPVRVYVVNVVVVVVSTASTHKQRQTQLNNSRFATIANVFLVFLFSTVFAWAFSMFTQFIHALFLYSLISLVIFAFYHVSCDRSNWLIGFSS